MRADEQAVLSSVKARRKEAEGPTVDEPHKITQRDVPRERERFEFTGQGTQRCGRGGQRQPSEEAMSASGASARPEMDGGGEASICQGPVAGWGLGHSGSQRGSVAGAE